MEMNHTVMFSLALAISSSLPAEAGNFTKSLPQDKREAIKYIADCNKLINRMISETFKFPKAKSCEDAEFTRRGLIKPKSVNTSEIFSSSPSDFSIPQNIYINVNMTNGKWIGMILERDDELNGFPYIMDGRVSKP